MALLVTTALARQPVEAQTAGALLLAQRPELGQNLTDGGGKTLLVLSADTPDASTCGDFCAVAWPTFQPPAGGLSVPADVSGALGHITRQDGSQQVTCDHKPLYTFVGDVKPGDEEGQNTAAFGGTWTVATP
jgi:predicted lipoprotein with Yx(FWY)xxD motif